MKVASQQSAGAQAPEPKESPTPENSSAALEKEVEVTETPTEEPETEEVVTEEPETEVIEGEKEGEITPFTPDFKLKVMDKEFEIPEQFRALMKDKTTESEVRKVFEKAFGLDFAKPKHEQVKIENLGLKQENDNYKVGLQELGGFLQNGDYQSFFEFWRIPEDNVLQIAANILRYRELPAEQRAGLERQKELERQSKQAHSQIQALTTQNRQAAAQARTLELETTVSRGDIASVATEYDTRVGQPGAFRQEVINRGLAHFYRTLNTTGRGEDLPIKDAVDQVMRGLGYVEQDNPNDPSGNLGTTPQRVVAPVQEKKLPVLPNVGSGGASPVRKAASSIAELRALSKKMSG